MLKLFHAPNACSLAPHIALNEAGADYQAILVDTKGGEQRRPEYLAINPKGKVPALATDRGMLTEVPVILGYIGRSYPAASLVPTDQFDFFQMQSFNSYLASTIHIAFAHLFRPERYGDSDAAKADMRAKVPSSLKTHFQIIEDQLADGRPWIHGDAYTVSDPYLYVFARWLEREGAGGSAHFPHLRAHRARMQARPAVQKTLKAEGLEPV